LRVSGEFNPYFDWLGIPPAEQPPHHYRLLGLRVFESNAQAIDEAAGVRMAQLRGAQIGKHAAQSQRLLNEVAAARACLINPARKAAYDAQLKQRLGERRIAPSGAPGHVGELQLLEANDAAGEGPLLSEFDVASLPPLKSADPLAPASIAPDPLAPASSGLTLLGDEPQHAGLQPSGPYYAAGYPAAPYAAQPAYPAAAYYAPQGAAVYGKPGSTRAYSPPAQGILVSLRALVLFLCIGAGLLLLGLTALVLLIVLVPQGGASSGGSTSGGNSIGGSARSGIPDSMYSPASAPGYGRERYVVTGLSQRSSFEVPISHAQSKFALSRNGATLAVVARDSDAIERFETAGGRKTGGTSFGGRKVMALAYSPVDDALAVALADGTLRLVNPDGSTSTLVDDPFPFVVVLFAPDGRSIATAGFEAQLVDRGTGTVLAAADRPAIRKLKFSPDGKAVCGFQLPSNVWLGGTPRATLTDPRDAEAVPLTWSDHGELVALHSLRDFNAVSIVSGETGQEVHKIPGMFSSIKRSELFFFPDSTTAASRDTAKLVLFQPVDVGTTPRVQSIPLPASNRLVISADGRIAATCAPGSNFSTQVTTYTVDRQPR
jgi:hypothetical protein